MPHADFSEAYVKPEIKPYISSRLSAIQQ